MFWLKSSLTLSQVIKSKERAMPFIRRDGIDLVMILRHNNQSHGESCPSWISEISWNVNGSCGSWCGWRCSLLCNRKCQGKGAFSSLCCTTMAWFMGVKVQSRVKISKTNLQPIGVRGSVHQARDGSTKTGISKEADAESRKHVEKDKRSDSGCHGKVRSPGKPSHIVRLLHLGQNATGSSIGMATEGTTVQDSSWS